MEGSLPSFKSALKQKSIKGSDLKWVDRTPQNNGIYYYTLFDFINSLNKDIAGNTGAIYDFIIQYFYTMSDTAKVEKIKRNLTSSYGNYNKQLQLTPKQIQLKNLIKSFIHD
jgi:hypothetical protein